MSALGKIPAIRRTVISAPQRTGRINNRRPFGFSTLESSSPVNPVNYERPLRQQADMAKGKIALALSGDMATQYPESAFEKSFHNIPFMGTDVKTQRNDINTKPADKKDDKLSVTPSDDWSIKALGGSQTAPSVSVPSKNTPPASDSAKQDFLNRMRQTMQTIQHHQ